MEMKTSAAVRKTYARICQMMLGNSPALICISIHAGMTKDGTATKKPMPIFRNGVSGKTLFSPGYISQVKMGMNTMIMMGLIALICEGSHSKPSQFRSMRSACSTHLEPD